MNLLTYLKIGAVAAVAFLLVVAYHAIKDTGRQEEQVERAAEVKRRLDNASTADTATARCLADPKCRLSNDGFRLD